jgi:hypothetical protein
MGRTQFGGGWQAPVSGLSRTIPSPASRSLVQVLHGTYSRTRRRTIKRQVHHELSIFQARRTITCEIKSLCSYASRRVPSHSQTPGFSATRPYSDPTMSTQCPLRSVAGNTFPGGEPLDQEADQSLQVVSYVFDNSESGVFCCCVIPMISHLVGCTPTSKPALGG